jgi:glycosyltransferase involved in cell wall biosynthesis
MVQQRSVSEEQGVDNSIAVLIPTYNRALVLQAVWPSYVADSSIVKQIVVVNDGSTDPTGGVLRSLRFRCLW